MEAEILHELTWIRRLLVALLVCASYFAALLTLSVSVRVLFWRRRNFADTCWEMLDRGEEERVIRLASRRLKKYPRDAGARWVLANAYRRRGDLWHALAEARKTKELRPEWNEEFTAPFLAETEQELATAGATMISKNTDENPQAPE